MYRIGDLVCVSVARMETIVEIETEDPEARSNTSRYVWEGLERDDVRCLIVRRKPSTQSSI